jgi:type II secretory pathway pseudopilin PulG
LLVVIAIIALLAAFAIPAFNSIGQARGVTEAAYQVAAAVELARSEAITRQTYVWLGLQPQTNSGNVDLRIGLVYSKDGSTNTAATNLQPIGKSVLIQRVGLVSPSSVVPYTTPAPIDLSTNSGGTSFVIGQMTNSDKRSLTFTPMGEVTAAPTPSPTNGFDPRIAVGLRQARGTTLMTNNDIAVVIDGSVGIPTIYRK